MHYAETSRDFTWTGVTGRRLKTLTDGANQQWHARDALHRQREK